MKTLVTGGAGFIGRHLVRRLLDAGDDVVVLDSLDPQVHEGGEPDLPDGVAFVHADVGDRAAVGVALDAVDRVVHLAAAVGVGQSMYEIEHYVRANSLGTAVLLEAIVAQEPRPSRLVVASSMSIYGEGEYECPNDGRMAPPPRPDSQLAAHEWELDCPRCDSKLTPVGTRESKPLLPTSVYAVTKRDHEELCLVTGAAYNIPTVALRFFNVYGPGQALSNPYTGVAAIFASRLMNGRPPVIFEDGAQSRDFIHVSDIVEGVVLALDSEAAVGHAVNLGTGRSTSVEQIGRLLADGLGVAHDPEYPERFRAGDIRHCFSDPEVARERLGFEAKVSLEDGMRDLLAWLSGREAVDRVDAATDELMSRGLAR